MKQPTREAGTEYNYLVKSIGRLVSFRKETGLDWDLNHKYFIKWISSYRTTISPASWRQNKAALIWYMSTTVQEPEIIEALNKIGTDECQKASRTSTTKKKYLSSTDIDQLTEFLMQSHEKFISTGGIENESISLSTLYYLLATNITGMRPSEWGSSKLYEKGSIDKDGNSVDTLTIIVKNGKSTNGRSHGTYRTLRFKDITTERTHVLLVHYRSIKRLSSSTEIATYYKACKDKMTYATRSLWPKRKKQPVLYSGRHQFSANLKKALINLQDQAALMGHATDETATSHYGKKKFGKGNENGVYADPIESSNVRKIAEEYVKPNRENKTTLDL
jgi:hypothetical protein